MLGVLLVAKPVGVTSHDIVQQARRRLGVKRIGHSGTLDPLASGLLVLAVGPATRFLQYLPLEPKVYRGRVHMGVETTTQDGEGEVVIEKPIPGDFEARLREALPRFRGLVQQMPPMFSAVKRQGKPLYAYARKGEEVEREPRTIHVERFDVLAWEPPFLTVEIECSGGTYVRTLAHDLGQALECGAHLSALERTGVGRFDLKDAIPPEAISADRLVPLAEALPPLRLITLNAVQESAIRNGQAIGDIDNAPAMGRNRLDDVVGLLDSSGTVIGVARQIGNQLQPECVIPNEPIHDVS